MNLGIHKMNNDFSQIFFKIISILCKRILTISLNKLLNISIFMILIIQYIFENK